MTEVTMYTHSSLVVWASWQDDELVLHGQDLKPPPAFGDEYEYWFVVPKDELHLVAQDIGADLTDPAAFLKRLVEHGDRIGQIGEGAWLKALGVTARFDSWF